jgi:hypothetical protein
MSDPTSEKTVSAYDKYQIIGEKMDFNPFSVKVTSMNSVFSRLIIRTCAQEKEIYYKLI